MCSHESSSSLILDRARDDRTGRRQRIVLVRDKRELVTLTNINDAGLYSTPEQNTVIRWLAAAARVKGTAIENDAKIGVAGQNDRFPRPQIRISEFEPTCAFVATQDLSPYPDSRRQPRQRRQPLGRGIRLRAQWV